MSRSPPSPPPQGGRTGRLGTLGADLAGLVQQATTLALLQALFTQGGEVEVGGGGSNLQTVVTMEHLETELAIYPPPVSEDSRDLHELAARFALQGR